jgi:hypothetical protein
MIWTTPSINCKYPWCVCTHPIDTMGIHFLHYVHGNKRIGTHDTIHNTFVAIEWDVDFHMGWEQLHVLPSNMFNSSRWWVDIVLTKDGIRTLVNIVIANPTWANLFPWSCVTQGFVAFDAAQAKEWSYHDRHPTDQFIPLTMEVFGCLHKQVDVFLHNCVNAIWILKGLEGLLLSVLVTFLQKKNSITLQRL